MRLVTIVLASTLVALVAGCSSETSASSTEDSADTEIRVGAKKSISGLRLGKYENRYTQEGEFANLTLESRDAKTPKELDGTWSGSVKKGGSVERVKGGFNVVQKKIPAPHLASGSRVAYVLKLLGEGGTLLRELSFVYVDNSVALFDLKTQTEQILALKEDSAGDKIFSLSCELTKLYDSNVFEEGLSKDEYPDISIDDVQGKLDVSIGAASFDEDDGDKIVTKSRSGSDIDLSIDMGDGYAYHVAVTSKVGVIEVVDGGKTSKVADFRCR